MADPSQAAPVAPPAPALWRSRHRYRIRFQKAGALRLVSHHDLMNCLQRMCRRASLPLAVSQGFHPQPKMVFALSLALGIVGANEVLEIELTQDWSEDALLCRLRAHAPPGIVFHSLRRLQGKPSAQVRRAFYRLSLDSEKSADTLADLPRRCRELLAEPHLWIERTRPEPRRLDLRPFLSDLKADDHALEITLWVTPHGTGRPEEVAGLLGLQELLENGAYFERTDLEMLDEAPADSALPEPVPPAQALHAALEEVVEATRPPARGERPTPLVSGPLSFDS